ncbi:MAG: hypothetical protein ACI9G1_002897 [Pirellulaceae bacterium]|jgi:hypothetical protein
MAGSREERALEIAGYIRSQPGLYDGWIKRSIAWSKIQLTETQSLALKQLDDLAKRACYLNDLRLADEIVCNPLEIDERQNRDLERITAGLQHAYQFLPVALLTETQAEYWWSHRLSRYLLFDFNDQHVHRLVGGLHFS